MEGDSLMRRVMPWLLALSGGGLVGIAMHEGFRGPAYDDGGGVWTVGFGTTRHADGRPVKPGDSIDPVRGLIRLHADATTFEVQMRRCLGAVPLFQHEWDAYVSLAYNIGPARWCASTVVRRLKQDPPDYPGACEAIGMWVYSQGRKLPGLERRRAAERRLCLGEG